jgi:hypothetical protein
MASSNLQVFGPLMKHSTTKLCATDDDVKQPFTSRLKIFDKDFFFAGLQAIVPW